MRPSSVDGNAYRPPRHERPKSAMSSAIGWRATMPMRVGHRRAWRKRPEMNERLALRETSEPYWRPASLIRLFPLLGEIREARQPSLRRQRMHAHEEALQAVEVRLTFARQYRL